MEVLGNGVIQFVSREIVIVSRGYSLFVKDNNRWRKWCVLPISFSQKLFSINKWFSRLTRNEINHLIKVDENTFACFAFGKIYLIGNYTKNVRIIGSINGSRPLCVCSDGEHLYYGVYKGNTKREPTEIWSYSIKNKTWKIYYTFKNIRHIHGVFWDEYESTLWATTGDLDHESTIWKFDSSGVPKKVVTGSQKTRAVELVFTDQYIYYATDAPDEENYICRIDRNKMYLEKIQRLGGPVFYGSKVREWIFFSTVVEPSRVNRTDAVELWGSVIEGKKWKLIEEFKKDFLPKKLFQYGQIKFPTGNGDDMNLYFCPYATEMGHKVMKLKLSDICETAPEGSTH